MYVLFYSITIKTLNLDGRYCNHHMCEIGTNWYKSGAALVCANVSERREDISVKFFWR